jgi:hypothetical protein
MTTTCEIVYWRDIPAQVKARAGRQRAARPLSERFQQAIDVAAMRAGKSGTDDYLAEWVTRPAGDRDEEPEKAAEALAAELESAFTPERLSHMANSGGVEG